MNDLKKVSQEVEVNHHKFLTINNDWVNRIKKLAKQNSSGKFRTCVHFSDEDNVHEMLIALTTNAYVRPHKHKVNGESLQFIEGEALAVVFNDDGTVDKAFKVGNPKEFVFFYSMRKAQYHMLIVKSDFLVFKETTRGPFRRDDTIFPDWAPDGSDKKKIKKYVSDLEDSIVVCET